MTSPSAEQQDEKNLSRRDTRDGYPFLLTASTEGR